MSSKNNLYQPPQSHVADLSQHTNTQADASELQGLSGWLVLVGIGVVLTPIRMSFDIYTLWKSVSATGTWEALSNPASENYVRMWAPLVLGEMFINGVLLACSVYLVVLYFRTRRRFPVWYIALVVSSILVILLDSVLTNLLFPQQTVFDPGTVKDFVKAVISALIWIPYMLVSKRVKATFVN